MFACKRILYVFIFYLSSIKITVNIEQITLYRSPKFRLVIFTSSSHLFICSSFTQISLKQTRHNEVKVIQGFSNEG